MRWYPGQATPEVTEREVKMRAIARRAAAGAPGEQGHAAPEGGHEDCPVRAGLRGADLRPESEEITERTDETGKRRLS